jgi:sugar lactone lactonase YvrE
MKRALVVGMIDGAAATQARLEHPIDVAVGVDGALYIADDLDHCVRRVDPSGAIATVAGRCGEEGFAGDGGPATHALLKHPLGIHLDPMGRRLYIADSFNNRIRVVTLDDAEE